MECSRRIRYLGCATFCGNSCQQKDGCIFVLPVRFWVDGILLPMAEISVSYNVLGNSFLYDLPEGNAECNPRKCSLLETQNAPLVLERNRPQLVYACRNLQDDVYVRDGKIITTPLEKRIQTRSFQITSNVLYGIVFEQLLIIGCIIIINILLHPKATFVDIDQILTSQGHIGESDLLTHQFQRILFSIDISMLV